MTTHENVITDARADATFERMMARREAVEPLEPWTPRRRILSAGRQGPDMTSAAPRGLDPIASVEEDGELRRINLTALVAMRLRLRGIRSADAELLAAEAVTAVLELFPTSRG